MVPKLANILALECNWFLCVWGAANGYPWLGPATVAASVAVHVGLQAERRRQLAFIVSMLVFGFAFDSLLALSGVMSFATARPLSVSPPPMVALWANLATAFPLALRWLHGHYWLGAGLGFVGGMLAYDSGVRFGAATFLGSRPVSLLLIGCLWAAIIPLLLAARQRLYEGAEPARTPLSEGVEP